MTLQIKNIEYFDWDVPQEIEDMVLNNSKTEQDIIDEFFQPDDLSVDQTSDTYYELSRIINPSGGCVSVNEYKNEGSSCEGIIGKLKDN